MELIKLIKDILVPTKEFFSEYSEYLKAKKIVRKYKRGKKLYTRLGFPYESKEIFEAKTIISNWKK